MEEGCTGKEALSGLDLLARFENILETDSTIDEIGFIHPSQFAVLEPGTTSNYFWKGEGKLGISTDVLLPLCKAAREAFFNAARVPDPDERAVMAHSKAVLLLSSDFAAAWNSRKLIISRKQHMLPFIDELVLSALVLSNSPKSDQAWCHRRWAIKMLAVISPKLQEIVAEESDLVEQMAERSKMNYRAWNHRCWLVSYMTREQVLIELKKSKSWAALHVADNSCFHYRARLLISTFAECCSKQEEYSVDPVVEVEKIFQEELNWNEELIRRYVGREALWLHRRFLSLFWVRYLADDLSGKIDHFLDHELSLISSCLTIPDTEFEDFQAQALYSCTYILWLMKHDIKPSRFQFHEKLRTSSLKTILDEGLPERSSLWNSIPGFREMVGNTDHVDEESESVEDFVSEVITTAAVQYPDENDNFCT